MQSPAWLFLALIQAFVPTEFGGVSGEIRALNGVPAVGVRVAAMPADSPQDAASATLLSLTQTDSAGRYVLENLPPGRYRILAGLLESPTFYPGVRTTDTATVVSVEAGVRKSGIDFALTEPPGLRVSGRVTDIPPDVPAGFFSVSLQRSSAPQVFLTGIVDGNGTFAIEKVPRGAYQIHVSPGLAPQPTALQLNDQDVENLELPLQGLLMGHVEVDGGGSLPTQRPSLMAANPVTLVRVGAQRVDLPSFNFVPVRTDGWFALPAPRGEYDVAVRTLPFGYSIASDEQAVQRIKVEGPPRILRFRLSQMRPPTEPPGVRVEGRVTGFAADTSPETHWLSMATVPINSLSESEQRITEIPVGPDGGFEVSGVPQGTFILRLLSANPSALAVLEPPTLKVGSENITGLELKVTHRPANQVVTGPTSTLVSQGITILAVVYVVDEQGRSLGVRPYSFGVRYATPDREGNQRGFSPNGIPALPFTVPQPGLYQLAITDLPEGYSVKTITKGGGDIRQSGLAVDGRVSSIEIQVTLEFKP